MAVSRLVNESQRRVPQLLVVPGRHPDGAANAPKQCVRLARLGRARRHVELAEDLAGVPDDETPRRDRGPHDTHPMRR